MELHRLYIDPGTWPERHKDRKNWWNEFNQMKSKNITHTYTRNPNVYIQVKKINPRARVIAI